MLQGVENARLEVAAPSYRGWKMRDWNYRHHLTGGGKCETGIIGTKLQGVENAGLELSAPSYRGWKMRDWKIREREKYGTPHVA